MSVVPIRKMRIGDTEPSLTFNFVRPDINGKLKNVDVSGATKVDVKCSLTTTPTVTKWTNTCTLLGGNQARLDFSDGDIDVTGFYELEVTIYWTAVRTETLPELFYIEVVEQKT